MMAEYTDDQLVALFDKFREETSATADDEQLKEWGHTPESILEIKLTGARCMLKNRSYDIGWRMNLFMQAKVLEK